MYIKDEDPSYLTKSAVAESDRRVTDGAMNMIKRGLEKAVSTGSEAMSTLAASGGYYQDSNLSKTFSGFFCSSVAVILQK